MSNRILGLLRRPLTSSLFVRSSIRHASSTSTSARTTKPTSQSRINTILARLPKFLRPYTSGLRNAPVSHITTFLLLHELTAIVPLIGLSLWFHYSNTLPNISNSEYVRQGIERFSRYFRRKGWFGLSTYDSAIDAEAVMEDEKQGVKIEGGTKVVLEVATAYAITKVLLPVRLLLSVWATPATARIGLSVLGRMGLRSAGAAGVVAVGSAVGKRKTTAAAGTGATGGGVV